MRIAAHLAAHLGVAVALAVLTGCGAEGGRVVTDQPSGGSNASPSGATELKIVVRSGQGLGKRTFTLRCDPPGGDHPDPEAACRALDALEEPFAPVPAGRACTEIYGGPQTATVTGTYRGEPVDAEFDRTNGCEISRWDAHVDLLVERGGADGT